MAAVILFVVVTTIHLIDLVTIEQLPGKIHTLIVEAPTKSYDIRSMLDDKDEVGELYSLFVQATLPLPMITGACDNSFCCLTNRPASTLHPRRRPTPKPIRCSVSVNGGQRLSEHDHLVQQDHRGTTTAPQRGLFHPDGDRFRRQHAVGGDQRRGGEPEIQSLRIMYTD